MVGVLRAGWWSADPGLFTQFYQLSRQTNLSTTHKPLTTPSTNYSLPHPPAGRVVGCLGAWLAPSELVSTHTILSTLTSNQTSPLLTNLSLLPNKLSPSLFHQLADWVVGELASIQTNKKTFVQAHAHTKVRYLETEILLRIVVGNALNQLFQQLLVVREFACFNPLTDHVAENTAEVVMTRVRQEAAGIR